ncbi:hypothetical protein ACFY5D_16695 [Paeniglutamicibacter sp. NPDC012692]|uniref:hypothetical protein n=1 Tax=Paeniglutamicibacter sp. NPDC012692 TaxID=3364388 RepID=UPI003695A05A
MSEILDNTDTAPAGEPTTEDTFKAPTTQGDLDRIIQARLAKERAKYSDYDSLKTAAQKLAEIEESNKTELEKAIARAEAAEQKLTDSEFNAMKARVAAKFQLEDEDVELFLTGRDEESLTKQAERLASKKSVEAPTDTHESTRIGFGIDLKNRDSEKVNSSNDELARTIFGV